LITLPKNFWTRVLGSVVIQLYAVECTPSVDRALSSRATLYKESIGTVCFTQHTKKKN